MKLSIPYLRQGLYALMIILPSVFTGNVYSSIDEEQSTTALLGGLNAISTSLYSNIHQSQQHLSYTVKLLLSNDSFLNFDVPGMSKYLGDLLYYNPTIGNAYIVDSSHTIVYGIDDTTLSGLNYYSHIDSALKGSANAYSTFIDGKAFSQYAIPIFSADPTAPPKGALVLTYDFVSFQEKLKMLNSSSANFNGYLIDTNGRIIAGSSNEVLLWQNRTVDINRIKQALDYEASSTFILFDEQPLNGIYYSLRDTGWTLLVTSTPHSGVQIIDIISWIAGILGLGGVTTSEAIRKRMGSATPPPDLPNIDPPPA